MLLGEEGRAVARAITPLANCPPIEIDGVAVADGRARAARDDAAAADAQRAGALEALRVSGARLRQDASRRVARASILGRALPLPKASPRRIVVIGDTGCRIKTADNVFQACNDPAQWPFAAVARAAAAAAPGSRHPRRRLPLSRERVPGGQPAAAPAARGAMAGTRGRPTCSHRPSRSCGRRRGSSCAATTSRAIARARAGGDSSIRVRSAPRQDCNAAADDAIGDYSEPYAVPLGTGRDADTQFIVFDSSLVGVTPLPPTIAMHVQYRRQYEQAFALAAQRPNAFFMNHHPVLAFAPNPAQPDAPYPATARCNRC